MTRFSNLAAFGTAIACWIIVEIAIIRDKAQTIMMLFLKSRRAVRNESVAERLLRTQMSVIGGGEPPKY